MTGIYAMAHMAVDLSCAFLVYAFVVGGENWYIWLLAYNFCAFAMQMPIGAAADRLDRNSLAAVSGCAGVVGGLALAMAGFPAPASVLAGLGNACFHVGGGVDVLNRSQGQGNRLGIFVAPGAFGIMLGRGMGRGAGGGHGGHGALWIGGALAFILLASAAAIRGAAGKRGIWKESGNEPVSYRKLSVLQMLAAGSFLGAAVLRSYAGMAQAFPWENAIPGSVWVLTSAVVLGKIAGGFLSDRVGMGPAALRSMSAAAAGFLCMMYPLPGILAVFCWNMSMPITLQAVSRLFPGAKGFGFGLLTFGLFLGFCPAYLEGAGTSFGGGIGAASSSPAGMAVMALLSGFLLVWGIRQVER